MKRSPALRTNSASRLQATALASLSLLLAFSGYAVAEGQPEEAARPSVILEPEEGDLLWFFARSKDELGSGGELHIYLDAETHPEARASFAKFTLGVGGVLPVHKHEKTEEISYFLAGEGVAQVYDGGNPAASGGFCEDCGRA